MAVPTITGLNDDSDILQNERVIDMDEDIAFLDPDQSQFTTMLMKVARSDAFSTKSEWLEDEYFPRLSSVASGGGSDGATITVAAGEGAYFRAGDIVRNARTGQAVSVTSVATDTLTVSIHLGRVAFAAAAASDQLLIVGNASKQGAGLGTRKITKRVAQFNYHQIQRNPYGFTRSLMASRLYGGPVPDKERRKKEVEHKRSIEYTLFWGVRNLDTSGTEPVGMAGGLFEFIVSNVQNSVGTLTKVLLDTYMRGFLQHGEVGEGVLFVSPLVAQAISGFLRDAWNPATDVAAESPRLWGAKVDGFISGAYGYKVPVIVKKDWNDFSSASGQYGGWAFYVNMSGVEMPVLRGTQLLRDRQANDADAYDEEFLTEFSVKIMHERKHGLITGVTG
jgi:hypothetical protein